ncbi:alcohol dehydrogenase catalytic domain-containing protein [Paenibacillus uliginis]|uniref:alcohol dehydrogenase catalytic domain-containing protein n=1 Tax=Paenibacillus uliginis TaxID=683737 RepID=UPI002452DF31|nr:alcohol dehydrogenase catalytic domain-containing protein [Paenibacillus uliginis]
MAFDDFSFELPLILGWDAAGTVIEAGEKVKKVRAGDMRDLSTFHPGRVYIKA